MLNLLQEFSAIIDALSASEVPYALCGGLAMSAHGYNRSTEDIDLLIRPEDLDRVEEVVRRIGYVVKAKPMNFSSGAVPIRRVTKIDPTDGDTASLDLLLVSSATQPAWDSREVREWLGRDLSVVSREGLILLKRFRSSPQDLVDISRLEEDDEED